MESNAKSPMLNGGRRRSSPMADAHGQSIGDDLIALGLTKTCGHLSISQERNGQIFKDYCGKPVAEMGGFCPVHGGTALIKQKTALAQQRTVMAQKQKLEEDILPLATKRVLAILNDEYAKPEVIVKIWQTTMDRIGLGAVTGIVLDADIKVDAPLDILRRMLTANMGAIEPDVEDAEVVDEES